MSDFDYDDINAANAKIDDLRQELVEANELHLSAVNGQMQLQAELEAGARRLRGWWKN